ncbi:MAG: hypothetical protein RR998_06880 [Oscillospiraceae bacterium]
MKRKKQKYMLPSVVECDLHTGESRVLECVELSKKQYQEQIIDPLVRILYEVMKRDIETGKFKPGEVEKE